MAAPCRTVSTPLDSVSDAETGWSARGWPLARVAPFGARGLPFAVAAGVPIPGPAADAVTPLPTLFRSALLLAVAVASVSFVSLPSEAQADEALERVADALEDGDAGGVFTDAATRVEVFVFGDGGMYRRGQATQVMRDFFRRYPPDRVSFGERSSSDDGRTAIGRYWSQDGGAPLRVRVVHRVDGAEWELVAIRIDRGSTFRGGH